MSLRGLYASMLNGRSNADANEPEDRAAANDSLRSVYASMLNNRGESSPIEEPAANALPEPYDDPASSMVTELQPLEFNLRDELGGAMSSESTRHQPDRFSDRTDAGLIDDDENFLASVVAPFQLPSLERWHRNYVGLTKGRAAQARKEIVRDMNDDQYRNYIEYGKLLADEMREDPEIYNRLNTEEKAAADHARFDVNWDSAFVHAFGRTIPLSHLVVHETAAERYTRETNPAAAIAGSVVGGVTTTLAGMPVAARAVSAMPKIGSSAIGKAAATRTGFSTVSSVARDTGNPNLTWQDMAANAAQAGITSVITIIPEVYARAGLTQLLAQPMSDIGADALFGMMRGQDLMSTEFLLATALSAGTSTGFAIRDVRSGAMFRANQAMQKAEIESAFNRWANGSGRQREKGQGRKRGEDGFDFLPVDDSGNIRSWDDITGIDKSDKTLLNARGQLSKESADAEARLTELAESGEGSRRKFFREARRADQLDDAVNILDNQLRQPPKSAARTTGTARTPEDAGEAVSELGILRERHNAKAQGAAKALQSVVTESDGDLATVRNPKVRERFAKRTTHEHLLGDHGVVNKGYFIDKLEGLIEKRIPFVYESWDGTNLGGLNESYKGRGQGYESLANEDIKNVWGKIIGESVRDFGGIMGRRGGDEFGVIWPRYTKDEVIEIRQAIENNVRAKVKEMGLDDMLHLKKGLPTGALKTVSGFSEYGGEKARDVKLHAEKLHNDAESLQTVNSDKEMFALAEKLGYNYNESEKRFYKGDSHESRKKSSEGRDRPESSKREDIGVARTATSKTARGAESQHYTGRPSSEDLAPHSLTTKLATRPKSGPPSQRNPQAEILNRLRPIAQSMGFGSDIDALISNWGRVSKSAQKKGPSGIEANKRKWDAKEHEIWQMAADDPDLFIDAGIARAAGFKNYDAENKFDFRDVIDAAQGWKKQGTARTIRTNESPDIASTENIMRDASFKSLTDGIDGHIPAAESFGYTRGDIFIPLKQVDIDNIPKVNGRIRITNNGEVFVGRLDRQEGVYKFDGINEAIPRGTRIWIDDNNADIPASIRGAASYGRYSNLSSGKKSGGGYSNADKDAPSPVADSAPIESDNSVSSGYKPLELPEIVDIIRAIGADLRVLKRLRDGARGRAYHGKDGNGGMIEMLASLAKDPEQAHATLGHELGHLLSMYGGTGKYRALAKKIKNAEHKFRQFIEDHPRVKMMDSKERGRVRRSAYKELGAGATKEEKQRAYTDALMKRADELGLTEISKIYKEGYELSKKWRPFDESADANFTKYRQKGEEVFADMMSIFLKDPDLLPQHAPTFWRVFNGWEESRNPFTQIHKEIQKLYGQGREAVLDKDRQAVRRGFDRMEDQRKAQKEADKAAKPKGAKAIGHWGIEGSVDKYRKVFLAERALAKAGLLDDKSLSAYYKLRSIGHVGGQQEAYIVSVENMIKKTLYGSNKFEISKGDMSDLGEYMMYNRIARGDRSDLFNPRGLTKGRAEELLNDLRKNWGDERFEKVKSAVESYNTIRQKHIIPELEKSGLLSERLLKKLKENEHYATFNVVKDFYDKFGDGVMEGVAGLKAQTGTFKDIGNPLRETYMNDLLLLSMAARNDALRTAVFNFSGVGADKDNRVAREAATGIRAESARRRSDGSIVEVNSNKSNTRTVFFFHDGKLRGVNLNKNMADVLIDNPNPWGVAALDIMRNINNIQRQLLTLKNLGFHLRNPIRDFREFHQNLRGNVFRKTKKIWQAGKEVWEYRKTGEMSADLEYILVNRGVLAGHSLKDDAALGYDKEITKRLESFGNNIEARDSWLKRGWRKSIGVLDNWLAFEERTMKLAGHKLVKEMYPELGAAEQLHLVRTQVGTSDIASGGRWTPWTNNLFLYSNSTLQGWYGSMEAFKRDPINYGVKAMMYTVIPKTCAILAKQHLLTEMLDRMGAPDMIMDLVEWYEESMNAIPDYYKARYDAIPMPIRSHDGRQLFLPIPRSFEMQFVGEAYYNLLDGVINGEWDLNFEGNSDIDWDWKGDASEFKNAIGKTLSALYAANPASGGLTPWLKVGVGFAQYGLGLNPYDPFYGRNVIPRHIFGRDIVGELKSMGRWAYKSIGGNIFWILPKEDDIPWEEKTLIEKLYGIPIIGNPAKTVFQWSPEPVESMRRKR